MNRTRPNLLSILGGSLAVEPDTGALERLLREGRIDWPALLEFAGGHLVTPSLAASIQRAGPEGHVPEEARVYLETIRTLNRDRNRMLRQQLVAIVGALNRVGIQPMALKGAIALLPDQYDGAQDRVIGDLDLMIQPDRIDDAAKAVLALGYTFNETDAARVDHHHIAGLEHPSLLVSVELHRRMLRDDDDSAPLMGAARWSETNLETHSVLEPHPATRLLHNALHAQISDGAQRTRMVQLRPLLEFAQIWRRYREELVADELTRRLRPGRRDAIYEYCAQTERWLGLPYPDNMPRSPREARELWLMERVAVDHRWNLAAKTLKAVRGAGWSQMPERIARHAPRVWRDPGYIRRRARELLQ